MMRAILSRGASTSPTRSTLRRSPSTADAASFAGPTEGAKMVKQEAAPAGSDHTAAGYSYPGDLARFVRNRWRDAPEPSSGAGPLPNIAALEGFFAVCYQASMLREEERPVVFRAILAE